MVQIKKPSVQAAIRQAAFQQVSLKGYHAASMPAIAKEAGITAGNIYRYYPSKFELFFDVLEPWMEVQLGALETACDAIPDPKKRLRCLLQFMWVNIPQADMNFARNIAQALATKREEDVYSRDLLNRSEARIGKVLESCLPNLRKGARDDLVRLIFMSHDGFVLNVKLVDEPARVQQVIETALEAFSDS
ncbi:TetR/AcrR family transcriptional regulator [Ruegeria sp.]|uniref:TetR/AcrR family transcriptional regulator n=1 Tax=Ruegeria sp. TaxID=1879320 RepID=UPI003B5B20E7